jgi:hypothetical protein
VFPLEGKAMDLYVVVFREVKTNRAVQSAEIYANSPGDAMEKAECQNPDLKHCTTTARLLRRL